MSVAHRLHKVKFESAREAQKDIMTVEESEKEEWQLYKDSKLKDREAIINIFIGNLKKKKEKSVHQ